MKVHHVGYLVKNIEKAIKNMELLGYKKNSEIVYDKFRDIYICFMDKDGYNIELVMPKSKESVVYNLSKKIGVSPYHVCYKVDSIDLEIEKLLADGYILMGEKCIAPAINDCYAVFLYNKDIGIIELIG